MAPYTIEQISAPSREELDQIMRLWLQGNLQAHQFIRAEYWKSNASLVRPLIQQSTLWIVRKGSAVIAFCGLQQDFIAGFFVDEKHRGRGVGTALMSKLQATYPKLRLTVYRKNIRATQFYKRQGFSVLTNRRDEETGEVEDVMVWEK